MRFYKTEKYVQLVGQFNLKNKKKWKWEEKMIKKIRVISFRVTDQRQQNVKYAAIIDK